MQIQQKEYTLKDGRKIVLRNPEPKDAQSLLDYMKQVSEETHYLVRYPEEVKMSLQEEENFVERVGHSEKDIMMTAFVGDKVIGNTSIMRFGEQIKFRHRGSLAIALVKEYWNSGLGTIMMKEVLSYAKEAGFEQVELGVYEDNERAIHLYEKIGFEKCGIIPRAFKLKDDTYRDEVQMIYYIDKE